MLNTMRCLTCDYADDDPSLVFPDDQHLAGFVPLERSCLAQLRRIIHATGAHIVLSTTWRLEPAMRAFLLQALDVSGIGGGGGVGDTPAVPGAGRGQEISAFLARGHGGGHAARCVFAILEDDDKHVASFASAGLSGRCVQTNMTDGLTEAAADDVIALLAGDFAGD